MDKKLEKLNRFKRLDETDSIILETVDNFLTRGEMGLKKYNQNMDREDLNIIDWINHSIEESMDNILYLTKLKKELMKETKM